MDEIKEFCHKKYNVSFPIFGKVDVNGPNAHPVYKYLRQHLPIDEGGGGGVGPGRELGWNFIKILVDKDGQPVRLFTQQWSQSQVEHAVYDLLVDKQRRKAQRRRRHT